MYSGRYVIPFKKITSQAHQPFEGNYYVEIAVCLDDWRKMPFIYKRRADRNPVTTRQPTYLLRHLINHISSYLTLPLYLH